MGHNRLGRLPRTRRWSQVVALLDVPSATASELAAATANAANSRLAQLGSDQSIGYCFWLLTRIAAAARGATFARDLGALGITVSSNSSALTVIAGVADRMSDELGEYPSSGLFGEIASLSARRALTDTVGQQGETLFGTSLEDVQRAFRAYSTDARFGAMARRFFAEFMSRSLRSFVDRELANHVGADQRFATVSDSLDFLQAVDLHAWQASLIVEDFAGGWYSLHLHESGGEISREETQRFVAHALVKLRSELKSATASP
jgi:hypothetical protein